jgi:hypothetical protein
MATLLVPIGVRPLAIASNLPFAYRQYRLRHRAAQPAWLVLRSRMRRVEHSRVCTTVHEEKGRFFEEGRHLPLDNNSV